uniref:Uncharacterized protein n=1 Tax=Anguilla anguilla TaxID=7936 RepID=A0A0E9QAD4_ANGAN
MPPPPFSSVHSQLDPQHLCSKHGS